MVKFFPACTLRATLSSLAVLAAVAVVGFSPLPAQQLGVVNGVVADSAGMPIFGAEVTLEGTRFRAFTDERGEFSFAGVSLGAHLVNARRLGFRAGHVGVDVSSVAAANVSIHLQLIATPLPPVVVRPNQMRFTGRLAGYYGRLEKRSSGVFITREQIDRENPGTLGQLLQRVPGINSMRGRAGITGVRMRGRRCAPLVWIDGTPMPAGEVDVDAFSPSTLHGIELYLGSTTAPIRFISNRDQSSCGTILLWSRGPDTDPIRRRAVPAVDLEQLVARRAVYRVDEVDQRARLDSTRVLRLDFPPSLYAAGVPGLVIAEFVVDTAGQVEERTVGIVSSTAPLFTEAVRLALETAAFVPAVKDGRPVRQLIQQPFKFEVHRQ